MISLHADLRNLQAPDNADRGIGQFTRCLLRQARKFAPRIAESENQFVRR